jgi:CheY-like chemotaxis protein
MIDPGQLEQVVMNLVVNARDAMPNGGRILIDVARVEVDATYASLSPGPTEGHHARLVVSDDGEGIGQSSLDRVFEPFFTTKPAGHGTGLGLAICHGIVTQNGGHIRIQSEPGHGTSVTVHLPLTEARSPQEHATLAEPPSQEPRSIFLVEDDAAVRTVLAGSLRSLGHDVTAVGSAEEAMGWMETHGRGRVDLAVVDVVLPGRSGPELVELLRQRWPEVAVIYVSGYWQEIASLTGFCTLQKPFRRADLAQAIDQALDSGEAADAG